ncbi:hypothetical protein G7Y89_g15511 [Cudoniella acicularis]|uniref:Uncharacterized protein n=1 Tax=Cudoniella acicularis TaxID=354080 RepID=A0A8H4VJP1_9HELO|nr:hypothetical protein G7Y89_g15511 [Cudoniella acicularis]
MDHDVKIPRFRSFWNLAFSERFLPFCARIDKLNPGRFVNRRFMALTWGLTITKLYKIWSESSDSRKFTEHEKQCKLHLALMQVQSTPELEQYWLDKEKEFRFTRNKEFEEEEEFVNLDFELCLNEERLAGLTLSEERENMEMADELPKGLWIGEKDLADDDDFADMPSEDEGDDDGGEKPKVEEEELDEGEQQLVNKMLDLITESKLRVDSGEMAPDPEPMPKPVAWSKQGKGKGKGKGKEKRKRAAEDEGDDVQQAKKKLTWSTKGDKPMNHMAPWMSKNFKQMKQPTPPTPWISNNVEQMKNTEPSDTKDAAQMNTTPWIPKSVEQMKQTAPWNTKNIEQKKTTAPLNTKDVEQMKKSAPWNEKKGPDSWTLAYRPAY